MCEHVHDWIPYLSDADGFFSKRPAEIPSDRRLAVEWFTGRVFSCVHQPCETFLFIPNGPYSPVECEMVTDAALVAA